MFQKTGKWCSKKRPNGVPENGQMVFQKTGKWSSRKRPNSVPLFGFLALNPSRVRGSGGVPKMHRLVFHFCLSTWLGTLFLRVGLGYIEAYLCQYCAHIPPYIFITINHNLIPCKSNPTPNPLIEKMGGQKHNHHKHEHYRPRQVGGSSFNSRCNLVPTQRNLFWQDTVAE